MSKGRADGPPRWVTVSWTLLIGGLMALLFWAGNYGHHMQEANLRHLLFVDTAVSASELTNCLSVGLPVSGRWVSVSPDRVQSWNDARHLRAELWDQGDHRRVELSTPKGRPLRDLESKALRACLSPG